MMQEIVFLCVISNQQVKGQKEKKIKLYMYNVQVLGSRVQGSIFKMF